MSDEMLAAIDLLTLELGYVTDGEGEPIEDEATIHFREDVDGTCEIRISSPGAHTIAAKIVETWNARTGGAAQAEQEPSWRCFHCDEVFSERKLAEDHFGFSSLLMPACIDPLRGDERALNARASEYERSWRAAIKQRDEAIAVSSTHQGAPLRHHANETLEEQEFLLKQSSVPSTDGASHD